MKPGEPSRSRERKWGRQASRVPRLCSGSMERWLTMDHWWRLSLDLTDLTKETDPSLGFGDQAENSEIRDWKMKIQCQIGTEVQCWGRTKGYCWVWREKKQGWRNSTDRSISMISLSRVFGSKLLGFRGGKGYKKKSRVRAPFKNRFIREPTRAG